MREIMVNQAQSCNLKELVQKFIPESIGKEIEKATSSIYPLQNVYIRKVKILKAPKFDLGKLMEVNFCLSIMNFLSYIHPKPKQFYLYLSFDELVDVCQVHGDYTEDIGAKLDRPAEEPVAEPTEVVGA